MLTQKEAEQLAFNFLMQDLNIPADDQDWFAVKDARLITENWYVVELWVEGYPDQWAIQVYCDTKECDPCYTFTSPLGGSATPDDLEELPEPLANAIASERKSQVDPKLTSARSS
jgi:hypothetical protein